MFTIVYDSRTGNVKRFVNKIGMDSLQICEDLIINRPFAFITYTTDFGKVPDTTLRFLERNHTYMVGVASSGNKVWGNNFAASADIISNTYNVPILLKFELAGTKRDIELFKLALDNLKKE